MKRDCSDPRRKAHVQPALDESKTHGDANSYQSGEPAIIANFPASDKPGEVCGNRKPHNRPDSRAPARSQLSKEECDRRPSTGPPANLLSNRNASAGDIRTDHRVDRGSGGARFMVKYAPLSRYAVPEHRRRDLWITPRLTTIVLAFGHKLSTRTPIPFCPGNPAFHDAPRPVSYTHLTLPTKA